ncbi:Defective in induced resistance 1 protein [Hibiscus syriacus]|uniref:Defective in induced resistance 1 protein n=1 Tax=Hibiscus syriacus TaxID=106335 RepID=A0A6A2XMK3_HIBSY|nr:Defective in induced resistance 1 protein [Hibiscus syriacus]
MALEDDQNGGVEKVAAVTFTAVKPQLMVEAPKAADDAVYKSAFGAVEVDRTCTLSARPSRSSLTSPLNLSFVYAMDKRARLDLLVWVKTEGTGCVLCLETEDVEAAIAKAVSVGGCCGGFNFSVMGGLLISKKMFLAGRVRLSMETLISNQGHIELALWGKPMASAGSIPSEGSQYEFLYEHKHVRLAPLRASHSLGRRINWIRLCQRWPARLDTLIVHVAQTYCP